MKIHRLALLVPLFSLAAAPAIEAKESRDVVHNTDDSVVGNTFGNCVRTKWTSAGDECAVKPPAKPAAVHEHMVISKEERTVYFGFNKALLTDESKQKLDSLAEKLKSDKEVKQARIAGYADRIGRVGYNEELSQKRAKAVRDYLIARGFINARTTETRWYGKQYPSTNCSDTLKRPELIDCLQKDRKVEIEIDYKTQVRTK